MLTIGYIVLYLIIGLIVSIATYIFMDIDDEFNIAFVMIGWSIAIFAFVVFGLGYVLGSALKWIGDKIKRIKK